MADPTRPEPQKIDPTQPGSKNFDTDLSLIHTEDHSILSQNIVRL